MTQRLVSKRTASILSTYVKELAFTDLAYYYEPPDTTVLDAAGQPVQVTSYTRVPCSFADTIRNKSSEEQWADLADIGIFTAEIRIIAPPIPSKGGRFKLIKKFNKFLEIQNEFEIVDIKERGVFGFVCALKRIEL